ncbi:MAG: ABC transporter permease, partial [Bacilli bacterium]
MSRALNFAKRNLKEIIRDPLSSIFNFAFPVAMLILFFCFTFGKTAEVISAQTPMFLPNNIVPGIAVFGFSFLTLFVGMLVSKDRSTSFTSRLRISPMKPVEFFLGYAIPMFAIALIQVVIVYLLGWLFSFGLPDSSIRFNPWTLETLITFVLYIPIALFFISAGIFFGVLVNEKAIGGISSIVINLAAIMSGMFMPISMMSGFKIVCQCLPFYHMVTLVQNSTLGQWPASVSYFDSIISGYAQAGIDVV